MLVEYLFLLFCKQNNKPLTTLVCLIITLSILIACTVSPAEKTNTSKKQQTTPLKKKVLFVNSYHPGYEWSDGITRGIVETFGARKGSDGLIDNSRSKVELRVVYMDTKRNKTTQFKKQAALKVKEIIDNWQPDLVITADDNAAKYLIVPYYKNSPIPFIFCGINQSARQYGFPLKNVTGMVEVLLLPQALDIIRPYAKGDRICALGADTISEHKNIELSKENYGVDFTASYANTFTELTESYLWSQDNCDLLFLFEFTSVQGFDRERFLHLIATETTIPSSTLYAFAKDYVLATCAIISTEQGEWAAKTALDVLMGGKITDVLLSKNHKARIYLNMTMAKKMGIIFPIELLERATFISESKVLF